MKKLSIAVLLLTGCAGRVPGTASWTPVPGPAPVTWDYGINGALLGRVVPQPNGSFEAYGCNNKNSTELTLLAAEDFVAVTCQNVNKTKKEN
jgi:hypothetical protein